MSPSHETITTFFSLVQEIIQHAVSQFGAYPSSARLVDERESTGSDGRDTTASTTTAVTQRREQERDLSRRLHTLLPNLHTSQNSSIFEDPSSPEDGEKVSLRPRDESKAANGKKPERREGSEVETKLLKIGRQCAIVAEDLVLRLEWKSGSSAGWKWVKEDVEALRMRVMEIEREFKRIRGGDASSG